MPISGLPFAKALMPETQKPTNDRRPVQRSSHHRKSQYEINLNAIWRTFDGWRWQTTCHHRKSLKTAILTVFGAVYASKIDAEPSPPAQTALYVCNH
jgi:hypothetical protein